MVVYFSPVKFGIIGANFISLVNSHTYCFGLLFWATLLIQLKSKNHQNFTIPNTDSWLIPPGASDILKIANHDHQFFKPMSNSVWLVECWICTCVIWSFSNFCKKKLVYPAICFIKEGILGIVLGQKGCAACLKPHFLWLFSLFLRPKVQIMVMLRVNFSPDGRTP